MDKRTSRGSILIAVVWILSIFSIFTVVLNRRASQELILGQWARDHVLSRWLAKAGIDRALLELQEDEFITFDAYNESWGGKEEILKEVSLQPGTFSVVCPLAMSNGKKKLDEGDYRYGVCDESARININTVDEATLVNLLKLADPDLGEDAVPIAQSIMDWRDKDDSVMPQGAEVTFYRMLPEPYEPRNGDFESVEELMMVQGMTKEIYDAIKDHITIYTEHGKVNFNTATQITLQALGLSEGLALKVIQFRLGEDGVEGTEDDGIFQVVEGITPALSSSDSLSGDEFQQVTAAISKGFIDVKSEVFRIHSIGRLLRSGRSFEMGITCVITRKGQPLYWNEGISSALGAS